MLDQSLQSGDDNARSLKAKVYLVDNDKAACDAILSFLKPIEVDLQTFSSAVEFLNHYPTCEDVPHCVILNLCLPDVDGANVHLHLKNRGCRVPIIYVSGISDVAAAVEALKRGAVDFLPKPVDGTRLRSAVTEALNRDFSDRLRHVKQLALSRMLAKLTPREREVMELLVQGLHTNEIARRLDISAKTVFVHRARILEKFGLENLVQLSHFLSEQ